MALAETARLVARLDLEGNFQSKLRGATASLKGLESRFSNTSAALGRTAQNLQRIAFLGAGAVAGLVVGGVKLAGDFEASLNTINTIARATPEALDAIGDSIRKVARDTGTPLEDLTQAYYDLLSAGVDAADAQGVLTAANTLSIGAISTTTEAIDLLTTAINVYGGDASQAAQFADEFAVAVERGKVTAAEIAGSYAQVAPLAKALGIENKELAAGYARLTASGTPAAEAATQMASAMTALLKTTPGLEKLQKQTGKNYAAIARAQGLTQALEQMRIDADKAGLELVDLVGRKEALLFILQSTGPAFAAYNADLAAVGAAAGTAAEQMGIRQQGLNHMLERLKANLKDAGITIGTALLPKLTPLIERLTTFINDNQGKIEQFGTDLADTFERVVAAIGGFDWSPFIAGLKLSADIAKGTISIFRSLPEGLQSALIGGFALNKVTGGLVTGLTKDIVKIGIDYFAGRGSSPVNPLFVADVTGGPGGGVAGGAKSLLGGLLKGALGIGLALGGAAIVGGAVKRKDVPTQLAGTIGGTALAVGGGALAFGPIGAAIGAAVAVFSAQQEISARSSEQAEAIGDAVDRQISGGAKLKDLETSLSAVDQGIRDISANPLLVLVQGTALDELKAMREKLQTQIDNYRTMPPGGPAMTDLQREQAAAALATHTAINAAIGGAGGVFLRTGASAGTLDANAAALITLFETSTNPSLHSMEANLGILEGLARDGDAKTRAALSDDIQALKALIAVKLDAIREAMAPFAIALDPNSAWRQQEFEITVNVNNSGPTARDTTNVINHLGRITTLRPSTISPVRRNRLD